MPNRSITRALVIHLHYDDRGGAETFSFRIMEILQRQFDEVVVLHAGAEPDLEQWRAWTGIVIDTHRVRFEGAHLPWPVQRLLSHSSSMQLLRYATVVRRAQKIAREYDLVISTFAECPVRAERMIQAIHVPVVVADQESLGYAGKKMSAARRRMHAVYIWFVRHLMGMGDKRLANQLTVVNSHWTGEQFLRNYPGAKVLTIHHGVDVALTIASPGWVPFTDRENNFIMIGRVVPAKRIEVAIEIVERLRARGHMVGLRVVGYGPSDYYALVSELASSRPWMHLHPNLDRTSLEALVARQKWGLHCFQFEHYGLAPAELQALGCLTFVHDSGGQREIIRNSAQRYTDIDDAVEKIDAIFRSPGAQQTLLAEAANSALDHKGANFVIQFEQLIDDVMQSRARSGV